MFSVSRNIITSQANRLALLGFLWSGKGVMSRYEQKQPSSDLAAFRRILSKCKHVVVLTGAGVSAESGVPTFRGAGGFWRQYQAQVLVCFPYFRCYSQSVISDLEKELASPTAFAKNPSLVWEFYHYRRELMRMKQPNPAHEAIAKLEQDFAKENKRVVVITQNIDELHRQAGTQNIIELHGTLFKTRCTKCKEVKANRDSPICEALRGRGAPDVDADDARIPVEELPRCQTNNCGGLLRPHVVWFGEALDTNILDDAYKELDSCDLCLVVGTSAVVYPAAMFAPKVSERNVPVAEFNIEATPNTGSCSYYFEGPCGATLPPALQPGE